MKKHHVAPSHELIWATGVTDVTRNVAHLQPSNTSSLESLIHWLSSGCQIWSWGDLWQNVSRKHEWQLEWTAWNEQGWNRCLQQQNATNTFIYLAGSCVHMHIYIYILYLYAYANQGKSFWMIIQQPSKHVCFHKKNQVLFTTTLPIFSQTSSNARLTEDHFETKKNSQHLALPKDLPLTGCSGCCLFPTLCFPIDPHDVPTVSRHVASWWCLSGSPAASH